MKVYVDGVMLINFLVDFLLLLGTCRLSGFPPVKIRLLAASLLGAVYSGCCLLPDFRFLGNILWRTVVLAGMGGIAFGWNQGAVRKCGIFVLLSLSLGGLAVCIGRSDLQILVLAAFGILCLCRISFHHPQVSQEYITLEISYRENRMKLLALRDTGNTLRDPITGRQALILSASAASRLTGLTKQQLQDPLMTLADQPIPGLRLLPFRTVGQGNGMMLAMVFDDVIVGGQRQRALVAFAPENFGGTERYQALTGGAIS